MRRRSKSGSWLVVRTASSLGHSTIAITLGIYSHVAPTLHDEAAELIANLLLE